MAETQLSLYQKKTFPAVISQLSMPITPPGPENTVVGTLPAYYAYLQGGEYSKYTPKQFLSDVKNFGLYLREKQLKDVNEHDINQWIATLKSSRSPIYTPKTINRKLSAINNYFLWLVTTGALAVNPAAGLHIPKVISPLPEVLFESECKQLLVAASDDPRSYLFVLLLLETGIKKEELLDLRVTHIDVSNPYAPELLVKHSGKKVKKDRKLKLPAEFVRVYEDYKRTYEITDKLFPYIPRFLERLLADIAQRSGVQKKVTASILRDTYAVRCLKWGEDIELVLKKLGLSESTWEDAKVKYLKLVSPAI
jgi:site-specific recombinase XerD